MQNNFGEFFKIKFNGHSHTKEMSVSIKGLPNDFIINKDDLIKDLKRRKAGAIGTTPRVEADMPEIIYGDGEITILFRNENIKDSDYNQFIDHPRPSHSDYVQWNRYKDEKLLLGGGISSGRMSVLLVSAGNVAKQFLRTKFKNLKANATITQIGKVKDKNKFKEVIEESINLGTSVGVGIHCNVEGEIPRFVGEPFFNGFESILSHLIFSIPGVKGIAFGDGFDSYTKFGHERNDLYIDSNGNTSSNNEGGINGGLTNGNIISFDVAVKPTPSIAMEQNTFNFKTNKIEPLLIGGRHDVCFGLRVPVIIESVTYITLLELLLCKENLG